MLFNAITAGGREEVYQESGYNRFTVRQLLAPFDQTAHLCKMIYLPPFVVHDTHRMNAASIDMAAVKYQQLIENFKNDKVLTGELDKIKYLNEWLKPSAELKF